MILLFCHVIVALSCLKNAATMNGPVVVLDYDGIAREIMHTLKITPSNPLHEVPAVDFESFLMDCQEQANLILLFIEDSLCSEDLSKKDDKGTPFYYMRNRIMQNKAVYLPLVTSPYEVVTAQLPPRVLNTYHVGSDETKLAVKSTHKFFYIFFQDQPEEVRIDQLRKHDAMMEKVFLTTRQAFIGPIVGMYIGKSNPYFVKSTPKQRIDDSLDTDTAKIKSPRALFQLTGVHIKTNDFDSSRFRVTEIPSVIEEEKRENSMVTKIAYSKFVLAFEFTFQDYDWFLDDILLIENGDEVGRRVMGVTAPWNWAYSCAEPLHIPNEITGQAVVIDKYKIQPFVPFYWGLSIREANTTNFNSTVHCSRYFSEAILASLFVCGICTSILFFGIIMLMNVQTNDNFDDISGKALIIGATASL